MGSEMSDLSNRKSFFSFLPPPDFRREKSKRKVKKAEGMEVPRKRTDAFVCATTFIRRISAPCKNVKVWHVVCYYPIEQISLIWAVSAFSLKQI